jgi:peptidylprolyl isomerase
MRKRLTMLRIDRRCREGAVPFVAMGVLFSFVSGCTCAEETPAPPAAAVAPAPPKPLDLPPIQTPEAIPAPDNVAKPPADAVKTASGIASQVLTKGTGTVHPRPQDEVTMQYAGWLKNGIMYERSARPMTLPLGKLNRGWSEAVQLMVVGEKRRVWIPAALAYGETPQNGLPAGDLTMDIELTELFSISEPTVPEDVGAPPPTAARTPSNIAYRILQPGAGRTPTIDDAVLVKYSGWTADGKVFETTARRGRPRTLFPRQLVAGLSEALLMMKEGEAARFWIPPNLAFGDTPAKPGAPSGPVVYDIELVKVKDKT